jgi:hypothetical protein
VNQSQRFVCPFCRETIVETGWPTYDHDEIEVAVRSHLTQSHPIRWRLSRKFRRAMRLSHA